MLKVDLKEGTRAEIDRLVGNRTALRDTLGWMFQTIVPLDVHLWQVVEGRGEPSGDDSIRVPHSKDVHIPLEPLDEESMEWKMNMINPIEKERRVETEVAEET